MKEIIINVPEDAVEFVGELIERIGGTIQATKNKGTVNEKRKSTRSRPFDFFGSWPDIPLDPKNYREKLWRKHHEL